MLWCGCPFTLCPVLPYASIRLRQAQGKKHLDLFVIPIFMNAICMYSYVVMLSLIFLRQILWGSFWHSIWQSSRPVFLHSLRHSFLDTLFGSIWHRFSDVLCSLLSHIYSRLRFYLVPTVAGTWHKEHKEEDREEKGPRRREIQKPQPCRWGKLHVSQQFRNFPNKIWKSRWSKKSGKKHVQVFLTPYPIELGRGGVHTFFLV